MSGDKPKTIGVEKEVWRRLKLLAIAKDCTLSEAVDYLLTRSGRDGKEAGDAEQLGDGAGNKPAQMD